MALNSIARYCLESNAFLAQDIMNVRDGTVTKTYQQRKSYGEFHTLYESYRQAPEKFREYTKMSVQTFDYILEQIKNDISRSVNAKNPVLPSEKLFLTLRYLADGTSFNILSKTFWFGRSTVSKIILETLKAIWTKFKTVHMPQITSEKLKQVSQDFYFKWQFPNCVGAIGVRHCHIVRQPTHKEVIYAISDADYNILAVELVSVNPSDGTTFQSSKLYKSLVRKKFNMPPVANLPDSNIVLPHVLIGDESYPLKTFLMRPYASNRRVELDTERTLFNERIYKACTPVECAFNVLLKKWNVLNKAIQPKLKYKKLIIKVTFLLYNMLKQKEGATDSDFIMLSSNFDYPSKRKLKKSKRKSSALAISIRDQFKSYLVENSNMLHNTKK